MSLFAPKSGSSEKTDQTYSPNRSDRFGQSPQNVNWTSPLDSSCRVDKDLYIEHPIWSPDERYGFGKFCTPGRLVRPVHRAVKPVLDCVIRVEVVF